jgi:hypothetical protein
MSAYEMTPAQHNRAAELYQDALYALYALSEETLNLSESTCEHLVDARTALERMDYCRMQQPKKGGSR